MTTSLDTLPEGGQVVIIGGGPGGTACALALKRLAREMDRQIHVTILEGKQFVHERHYNQCVGVLSPPLAELLEIQLEIPFPQELCLVEIDGYILHSSGEQICLGGVKDGSISVRRVLFDAYMLDQAAKSGIYVLPARATDLEFHADRVVVYTENEPLEADVVIGAFGLDEGSAAMFSRVTAYQPPKALDSIVINYHPKPECIQEFGSKIHAFLPKNPRIEFGAITPKCNHLTINIAGISVDSELMKSFLQYPDVQAVLPDPDPAYSNDPNDLNFFKGRFPRSIAHNYYGDRYVMIGDASGLVRAFKGKGSTTAVMTGIRAAETIIKYGISKQAFHNHYRTENEDIIEDLPYGRFFRQLTIFIAKTGFLDLVVRAANQSPELQEAMYDAVSALDTYQSVVRKCLRPGVIRAVFQAMFRKNR